MIITLACMQLKNDVLIKVRSDNTLLIHDSTFKKKSPANFQESKQENSSENNDTILLLNNKPEDEIFYKRAIITEMDSNYVAVAVEAETYYQVFIYGQNEKRIMGESKQRELQSNFNLSHLNVTAAYIFIYLVKMDKDSDNWMTDQLDLETYKIHPLVPSLKAKAIPLFLSAINKLLVLQHTGIMAIEVQSIGTLSVSPHNIFQRMSDKKCPLFQNFIQLQQGALAVLSSDGNINYLLRTFHVENNCVTLNKQLYFQQPAGASHYSLSEYAVGDLVLCSHYGEKKYLQFFNTTLENYSLGNRFGILSHYEFCISRDGQCIIYDKNGDMEKLDFQGELKREAVIDEFFQSILPNALVSLINQYGFFKFNKQIEVSAAVPELCAPDVPAENIFCRLL